MAEQVLTDFLRALRSADVRVSTSETIDAANAIRLIGYEDRDRLANTLRCVLAKSAPEKQVYDRLFELYFSRQSSAALFAQEEPVIATSDGVGETDMMSLVRSGDETAIAIALEQAGQVAGIADIRFSTQVSYFAQKMMKALGVEQLETEMMAAFRERTQAGANRADALIDARKQMFQRARVYAERAFEIYGTGETERFRQDFLLDKAISAFERRDQERLQVLVTKIAKRLAVKHSRRRRKKNRGKLDLRKTLRANAGFDGVPFDLSWRQTRKDRPKIVAVCDVSGSVAQTVRFFLMLLHSLKSVVPEIETFAFSGRLEDVGDLFETHAVPVAMDHIIQTVGMSMTDYGQSLSDLKLQHWQKIDRRTTVIMLGDGRSNYGDPRTDLFAEMSKRSRQVIWLSPEGKVQWDSGDSEILKYKPYCKHLLQVRTLKDLERVIDDILASYV